MRIAFTNDGDQPVAVPNLAALEITPENGLPFHVLTGHAHSAEYSHWLGVPGREPGPVWLAPGETKRVDWEAGRMLPFFHYGFTGLSCLEPGRYRARLIADDAFTPDRLGERALTLREPWLNRPAVSNEATLTIVRPAGVNAPAWEFVRDKGPLWPVPPSSVEIWQRYRDSAYAAYAIPLSPLDRIEPRALIDVYSAALRKEPRGAFGDFYRLQMVDAHRARNRCFAYRNEVVRARQERDAADDLLKAILAQRPISPLDSSARYEFGLVQQWPLSLRDFHAWPMASVENVRRQVASDSSLALTRVTRGLDEFATAVDAVPADRSRALAALRGAISEMKKLTNADPIPPDRQRQWIDALVDAADRFAAQVQASQPSTSITGPDC